MTLDASPWGLGGVLEISGVLRAYFASRLTMTDTRILKAKVGDSKSHQTFELLCILVALRAWLHQWRLHRVLVRIRSDNLAALVGAARLKGKAGLILREISYVYTEASFEPALCEHIPGVCNVIADALSRWREPGKSKILPAPLQGASLQTPPPRLATFYRAAPPP